MPYDDATDFSGILGKLGGGPSSGGLLGGKLAAQPMFPPAQQPAAAASAAAPDLADLERVFQQIHDNAATLMALGGGIMTGGVGHGFEAAAKVADSDRKHQADSASRDATLRALLSVGVPSPIAQAAVGNPTVLKALSGHVFAQPQPAPPRPASPQTMKVRLAAGGDAVVKWDPAAGQYVQVEAAAEK